MGRPSLATERTEQIVLAACRCVARSGLDGATLEQISAESGLSRGHIRHYVGSRDNLMDLVWVRVSESFLSELSGVTATDPQQQVDQLLDRLFAEEGASVYGMHVGAFLLSGVNHDALRPKLDRTISRIEAVLHTSLERFAPEAAAADRSAVVAGLLRLLLGNAAYLAMSPRRQDGGAARGSADRLLRSLRPGTLVR
ncbi:TetR/AcrR family transcriptional regulator [Aeromicrobium wangtongii]|uniref:TetR/AcrR family transcriptional regulator n=1 Tax=Aeromicrobium wangtongii TaxID=2969247 RepID=UPI002017B529|nr:TetR family transcriptional regulator [Aeromicrobium wangtongii]MCL3816950.1 TetR family transcriptional regulator [Aeromicrobium wangtongii]